MHSARSELPPGDAARLTGSDQAPVTSVIASPSVCSPTTSPRLLTVRA